jgi:hypothetical protein
MLDEFPALGRLDFFESALAFMPVADRGAAHGRAARPHSMVNADADEPAEPLAFRPT